MKEKEIDRRLDLSSKFMRMGQSLITEGRDNKDIAIAQIGTILIFMSGLLIGDDDDIFKFSDLCSMFSSQKILDSLNEKNPLAELFNNRIDDDTYDEFVKRINSLRKKKDDKNDDDVN